MRRLDADTAAFYQEVGRRVAEARRHAGLSQQQVADLLRVQQAAISNYERGKRGMPLATFVDLADVLNVDPDVLLSGGVWRP